MVAGLKGSHLKFSGVEGMRDDDHSVVLGLVFSSGRGTTFPPVQQPTHHIHSGASDKGHSE